MTPDPTHPSASPRLRLAPCIAALLVPVAAGAHGGEPPLVIWLGSLHPAAVHFPIAMLLGAALTELLLATTRRESFGHAVRVMIWMAAAGAMVAARSTRSWLRGALVAGALLGTATGYFGGEPVHGSEHGAEVAE